MQSNLEILIPQFGETDDAAVQQRAVADYRERLRSYPGGEIKGTVATRNIGKGADWIVVAISFAGLFFTIPKAHKVVRESWEEWQRIYKEIKAIFSWLVPHQPAYYPDGYLFLVAVSELVKDLGSPTLPTSDWLGFRRTTQILLGASRCCSPSAGTSLLSKLP